jgi:hypothetical protein
LAPGDVTGAAGTAGAGAGAGADIYGNALLLLLDGGDAAAVGACGGELVRLKSLRRSLVDALCATIGGAGVGVDVGAPPSRSSILEDDGPKGSNAALAAVPAAAFTGGLATLAAELLPAVGEVDCVDAKSRRSTFPLSPVLAAAAVAGLVAESVLPPPPEIPLTTAIASFRDSDPFSAL